VRTTIHRRFALIATTLLLTGGSLAHAQAPAKPASEPAKAAEPEAGAEAEGAPAAKPEAAKPEAAKPQAPKQNIEQAAGSRAEPAPTPMPTNPAETQSYAVRMHDLERRVNELKEQIFRSKARLNLLKETVLHGVIAGARAMIVHRNEMGSMYKPVRYVYALDGAEIFARSDDTGKLGDQKEIEIFNGSIVPGNHTLSVMFTYQGAGLPYLKGYKFTAQSSHTFTAAEGKQVQLKVVGFEKGNAITTDPKDRPSVDFRMTVLADSAAAASATPAKK
jgi:hypothetical protein